MDNKKVIEILASENAIKKALYNDNYKKYIFAFENEWNGEKYKKLYKFNYNNFNFEEIEGA